VYPTFAASNINATLAASNPEFNLEFMWARSWKYF
jgi:hypothetical protein